MDSQTFFKKLKQYYGPYENPDKAAIIMTYVQERIPEKRLQEVYEWLLENYPSYYQTPPDIRSFNEALGWYDPSKRELDALIDRLTTRKPALGEGKKRAEIEDKRDECS